MELISDRKRMILPLMFSARYGSRDFQSDHASTSWRCQFISWESSGQVLHEIERRIVYSKGSFLQPRGYVRQEENVLLLFKVVSPKIDHRYTKARYGTQIGNLKLLDLNRVPSSSLTTASVVKKPMERNRTKSLNSHRSGSPPKNTLKMKITKKGILPYQGFSLVFSGHHHHQTLPMGLLKVVPKSSSAILGESYESPENNLLQIHEIGSKTSRFAASPYLFEKPYGTIAEFPKCLVDNQDTSFTYLETTQSSIDKTEPELHDPIPRGFGASNHSITEHFLPTKQEEYVNYHLKSLGCKPGIVDRDTETKEIFSGKNFEREANVLRQPLHVLSEDNHGRKNNDDHLFSLTYKRREIQRMVGS